MATSKNVVPLLQGIFSCFSALKPENLSYRSNIIQHLWIRQWKLNSNTKTRPTCIMQRTNRQTIHTLFCDSQFGKKKSRHFFQCLFSLDRKAIKNNLVPRSSCGLNRSLHCQVGWQILCKIDTWTYTIYIRVRL